MGYLFGDPNNKDHNISGSLLESPYTIGPHAAQGGVRDSRPFREVVVHMHLGVSLTPASPPPPPYHASNGRDNGKENGNAGIIGVL